MRKIAASLAVAAAAAGIVVGPSSPALAAPQCTFTPHLPARVSLNNTAVAFTAKITVRGTGCTKDMQVDTQLAHRTDSYDLWWPNTKPIVEAVYASDIVPGTYRTTKSTCQVIDDSTLNNLSCAVTPASTIMKFAGRAQLQVVRSGAHVTFHALATRYRIDVGFKRMTDKVAIQRLSGGTWRTIHTATAMASSKTGYSWTYRHAAKASYRAVSAETGAVFSGTSHTVVK